MPRRPEAARSARSGRSGRPGRTARTGVALAACGLLLAGCAAHADSSPPAAPVSAGGSASASAPSGVPVAPLGRSLPVGLTIASIGVHASVMSVGLNPDGTVGVPPIEANAPAAWYDGTPTPGQTGPSVILGHVTVGQFGDGVFLHLSRMRPGDRIEVKRQDGSTAVFTVDRVQTVGKSAFPTSAVYGNVDHPALRLITCGGPHLSGGGYPDNVIVYASLTGTAS
ncbi:class F sortase [Streptacidiphilus anmyonensis]|uniref:class F sortase n=1 Tax=Streptacidiphilus anmyonensis TaxID=405782 RepID=UPI0009FC0136|nr:class F sortase [Streptacidiphilus anmyonensis]